MDGEGAGRHPKPTSPPATASIHRERGNPLGWLGHRVAHHPWQALVLWAVVLVVCLLPAANVGKVITGSFSNPLPSNDESVQAQNAYTAAFPHSQSSPSSEIVLLEAPDVTGPVGKNATLAVTAVLLADHGLKNVSSVLSLYEAYSGYLVGQVAFGWSFLGPGLSGPTAVLPTVNQTAEQVWNATSTYLRTWQELVDAQPGTPASQADWPAYHQTLVNLTAGSIEAQALIAFYNGDAASPEGFNATILGGCLATRNASSCAEEAMEATLPSLLSTFFPSPSTYLAGAVVLSELTVGNWSRGWAQEGVAARLIGEEVGIAPGWLYTAWAAFPSTTPPSAADITVWALAQTIEDPLDHLPLPIPTALYRSFVSASNSATLVIVSFNDADTDLVNGSSVNYADASDIQHDVALVLGSTPAFAGVRAYETGSTPLDDAVNTLATSALGLLLALTILVLLVIMLLYFRSPSAPLLAFTMIGIALTASFAVLFLVGTYITTFNSEIESIVLVFLMSIGTDYSVFLLARYREELVRGTPPRQAVETTVRWAGQSIATSGMAVMVVALALTLSGISFLNELGIALLISVFFALLVNLTVLPSILVLVGPKVFWPNSGERFSRYAERRTRNIETHRDLIARAGGISTRRPVAVVGLILLLSVPVVALALEVPVSYDITNLGLPASSPAQQGFEHLDSDFGASYSSPSYVLVTFSSTVVTSAGPNVPEFQEMAALSGTINSTAGVSSVSTLVGSGGAPLGDWLNFSLLPSAVKLELNATLPLYVGADGRTVLFDVQTNASGYSAAAIGLFNTLEGRISTFEADHPGISKVYYGGAAPTTKDIQSLVNQAEEEMLIGAVVGLFLLMLAILGSAFVPLLALCVIGLSILWSWAGTYVVVGILEGEALIFLLPLILLILVLGLGMDYNVLLLTRVKEERARGNRGAEAIQDAVTHAGGVITAAAVILGGAFLLLGFTSPLGLLAAIGLGIGFAVLLQAFVVQLFLTPSVLTLGKDTIWRGWRRRP